MSDALLDPIPDDVDAVAQACRAHARDLVRGARVLRDQGMPHLAYHLAILALEEIGKSELVVIGHLAAQREDATWPGKHASDHVKKLFWALWGPTLGQQLITKEQIESFQGLAQRLHDTRMRGLYASADVEDFYVPQEQVTPEALQVLLGLVENRLEVLPAGSRRVLDDETKKDLVFFTRITDDPEKRRLIFSKTSLEKLTELGNPQAWIRWLRQQFEEADAIASAAAEQELRREEPAVGEAGQPKWQVKVRIISGSYSIRPKPLNTINAHLHWLKLYAVDKKKDQLLVEFTLPKQVSIHALWWVGLGAIRRFVVALNIGTMGFFWWYVPEQISHYYEKLIDLETNSEVGIGRSPALKIGWPQRALTEEDWNRVLLCLAMMPHPDQRAEHPPYDHYATGLTLMSKTDIHLQFEPQAFTEFFESLKAAMGVYGDWVEPEEYRHAFHRVVSEIVHDPDEPSLLFSIRERLTTQSLKDGEITLEHVGKMKLICDGYFLRKFNDLAKRKAAGPRSTGSA